MQANGREGMGLALGKGSGSFCKEGFVLSLHGPSAEKSQLFPR